MSIQNLETIKLLNRFSTKVKNNFNSYENPKYHISKLSNNSILNDNLSKANILEIRNLIGFKTTFPLDKPEQGNKYTLSFGLSFFCENPENDNSETSINKKIFFGNSYRTKRIEISIDEVNNITIENQNNNLQVIFFNTEQFEFQIAIEIILNEVPEDNDEIIINQIVLGWSIINTQNVSSNDLKAPIYKGTIRDLICNPEVHDTSSFELINGADLIYIFEKNNNDVIGLNDIKFLIPQYYFIGNSNQIRDYIPGLLNKYIPNNIHDINDKVKLSIFKDIYLKNIDIEFPNLENADKYLINDYKEYKGIPLNGNINAEVSQRFCKCYIHNTFRQLIKKEPEKIVLTQRNDHLINQNVIQIENFFVDEMGFCAIIIELFFSLKIDSIIVDYPIGITYIIPNNNALNNTSNIIGQNEISLNEVNLLSDFRKVTFIGNNAKAKCHYILSLLSDTTNETYLDKKIENLTNTVENLSNQSQLKGINPNNKLNTNKEIRQYKEELENTRKEYIDVYQKKPNIDNEEEGNINSNSMNPNTNFIIDNMGEGTENPNIDYNKTNPLVNTLENPLSGEIHETNYFEEQKKKTLNNPNINTYGDYKDFKESQMNQSLKNYQNLYDSNLNNNNISYNEQEKVNYNDEYYKNSTTLNQNIINQPNQGNVLIYNTETNKNISKADMADLINQGILTLPNDDEDINKIDIDKSKYHDPTDYDLIRANQSLLDYTYNQIIENHLYFGDIFTFQFISFKPLKTLESYNSVPTSIYFKFTFWSFGEFQTENAEITKPLMNSNVIPNNIPLFIYKQNAQFYQNSSDKDMKITISYDPSIDNNIDYKLFVKYLLYKDLFIEIFDNEKQMVFGYVKVPLKKLIRATDKRNLFELIHVPVYDNQNYTNKGELEILLKSDETKTSNNFDIMENANKFKYFSSLDQYEQNDEPDSSIVYYPTFKKFAKKKVVSVGPMAYGKMLKKDKEIVGKNIIDSNTRGNIEDILKKKREMREKRTNAFANYNIKNTFKLDKQTEKKVRVLKYLDDENEEIRKKNSTLKQMKSINNLNNNTFIPNDILKANMNKLDKENEFYENLNYANYIKSINKQKVIEKAINESNKNILSLALIQGQPHYFNYIITNKKPIEELYHVVVSQTRKKKKMINDNEENVVSLITNPEEFEYITKKYNLKIPEDYNFISDDYQITLKPNQSVPLLVKILCYDNITGYDDNINNKYSIFVSNEKNIPLYYMNIEITNVFPVIDFEFYHNVPQKKLSLIKFINPFKFNNEKTQRLLNYYTFINDGSSSEIKLDSTTNNFYFKYNDNTDNNSNNQENIINPNNRLLFFYLDKYKSELFTTFKFNIKSYETIHLSTDIGIRSKNILNIPPSSISRTIQFYSSDPDTLYFDDKYKELIILIPNYPYTIEYIIYPKENKNYEILVNCVDISTNEVIKNFLIKTNPNKPAVYHILNINAQCNDETILKFQFQNPLSQWAILKFDSSNKKIVVLDNDLIQFNPDENKYVSFRLLKQGNPGKAEAYIFVSDNEELFNQAILLDINYYS